MISPTVKKVQVFQNGRRIIYSLALTGNYLTGGDTCSLINAADSSQPAAGMGRPIDLLPKIWVSNTLGYYAQAVLVAGATIPEFKVQWFTSEGNELANGAYPAALLAGQCYAEVDTSKTYAGTA